MHQIYQQIELPIIVSNDGVLFEVGSSSLNFIRPRHTSKSNSNRSKRIYFKTILLSILRGVNLYEVIFKRNDYMLQLPPIYDVMHPQIEDAPCLRSKLHSQNDQIMQQPYIIGTQHEFSLHTSPSAPPKEHQAQPRIHSQARDLRSPDWGLTKCLQ